MELRWLPGVAEKDLERRARYLGAETRIVGARNAPRVRKGCS